jgi:hypothetical protein
MENAVKKYLVPLELFGKLATDTLSAMDKEMHEILYSNETSDELKWKSYNQVLQRYLHHVSKSQEPVEIEVISNEPESHHAVFDRDPFTPDDLLPSLESVVPKRLLQRAKTLYFLLKQGDIVSWDKNGVVAVDDKFILNSNILELIKNSVVSRKNTKPTGWSKFALALQDCDIPRGILGDNFEIEVPRESPRKLRRLNYDTNREHTGLKVKWKRCRL